MLNPQNTPQAKPVKIRIMSGGEEHSSLDSLLHHFDIEDVCSLLDGRLSRWLKGQNEQELAEYIESIENKDSYDDNQKLIIIKHFFAHEDLSKYSNLADVAELWSISDAFRYNGKSLYLYVVKTCDAEELLKIYEKKDDLPYINNWLDLFEQHKDEHNADVWYWYGVLSNQNSWIEKAAKDGSSLAKDYIQIEEKTAEVNANNLRTIKMRFGDSPYNPRKMSSFLYNFMDLNLSDKEKTIIDFLNDLVAIRKIGYQWDTILEIFDNRWGEELEGESFLRQEKMFLLGLYAYYDSKNTDSYSTILRKTCRKFGVSYDDIKEYEMVKRMSKHNYDAKGYDGIIQDFIEHFFQSYGV